MKLDYILISVRNSSFDNLFCACVMDYTQSRFPNFGEEHLKILVKILGLMCEEQMFDKIHEENVRFVVFTLACDIYKLVDEYNKIQTREDLINFSFDMEKFLLVDV